MLIYRRKIIIITTTTTTTTTAAAAVIGTQYKLCKKKVLKEEIESKC
jgi:hypothetical protein